MKPTAQDILNHCEAVCEKREPQPLPFTIKKTGSTRYSAFLPSRGGMDLLIADLYDADNSENTIAIFARLLGLDKPEIVLEWDGDKFNDTALYNKCIGATVRLRSIATTGSIITEDARNKLREMTGEYFMDVFSAHVWARSDYEPSIQLSRENVACFEPAVVFLTRAEAQKWCADTIKKIVTQTPKQ